MLNMRTVRSEMILICEYRVERRKLSIVEGVKSWSVDEMRCSENRKNSRAGNRRGEPARRLL